MFAHVHTPWLIYLLADDRIRFTPGYGKLTYSGREKG